MNSRLPLSGIFLGLLIASGLLHAETGREAWLRYAPLDDTARAKYASMPASTVALGDSPVIRSAQQELLRGVRGMLGKTLRVGKESPQEDAIVIGTLEEVQEVIPTLHPSSELITDGFWITTARVHAHELLIV